MYHLEYLYVIVLLLGYTFPHMFFSNMLIECKLLLFVYVWAQCAWTSRHLPRASALLSASPVYFSKRSGQQLTWEEFDINIVLLSLSAVTEN